MRWDQLFADLEGQWHGVEAADARSAQMQVEQQRRQSLTLSDRLVALHDHAATVTIGVGRERVMRVRLHTLGAGWIAGRAGEHPHDNGIHCLIPTGSITWVSVPAELESASLKRISSQVQADQYPVGKTVRASGSRASTVTLSQALRDLGRKRVVVDALTSAGSPRGHIRRVAADHLDLGMAEDGARRVGPVRLIPFAQLEGVLWSFAP